MAQIVSAIGSTSFFIGSLVPIWVSWKINSLSRFPSWADVGTLQMIDRLGRRKTMLFGLATCSLGYFAIGAATGVGQAYPQHKTAAGWVVVGFLNAYYFCCGSHSLRCHPERLLTLAFYRRMGLGWYSLACCRRDELACHARPGNCDLYCCQLALKLHRGPRHSSRNRKPAVQVLFRLGYL